MTKKLYLPSGYVNWKYIDSLPVTFVAVIGGRGTGKTYGLLDYQHKTYPNERYMFMRRLETQVEKLTIPEYSPYEQLNIDNGWSYQIVPRGKGGGYATYHMVENEDGKMVPEGSPVAAVASLSTFSTIRGTGGSSFQKFFFDEFIKQPEEKPIKEEGFVLLHAYETLNRNREFSGLDPIKMFMLANSNNFVNPVFKELGIMSEVEKMYKSGMDVKIFEDRGLAVIILRDSPISEKKAETAIYRLAGRKSRFSTISLDNDFIIEDVRVRSAPIKEYRPVIKLGEITIYRHKSTMRYYATQHSSGRCPEYGISEMQVKKFRAEQRWAIDLILREKLEYENYWTYAMLTETLKP